MRRYVTIAASAVIAALVLPVTVNVATSSLPGAWQPYLWWPVSALLAVVLVVQQVRRGTVGTEVGPVLQQTADALAAGVRQRWQAELELQDLVGQALMRLRWSANGVPGDLEDLGALVAGRWGRGRMVVWTSSRATVRSCSDPGNTSEIHRDAPCGSMTA